MARRWRFTVNTRLVPHIPSEDDTWNTSADAIAAFKRVSETVCPILAKCKERCRWAKIQGAIHALEDILEWCKSHPQTLGLPLSQLTQMSNEFLAKEETPAEISEDGDAASISSAQLDRAIAMARTELDPVPPGPRGWECQDSMYTDADFRLGCLVFTKFYKERTREIRLAHVCGYRDALADMLAWAQSASDSTHQGDLTISVPALITVCFEQVERLRSAGSSTTRRSSDLHRGTQTSAWSAASSLDSAYATTDSASSRLQARSSSHRSSPVHATTLHSVDHAEARANASRPSSAAPTTASGGLASTAQNTSDNILGHSQPELSTTQPGHSSSLLEPDRQDTDSQPIDSSVSGVSGESSPRTAIHASRWAQRAARRQGTTLDELLTTLEANEDTIVAGRKRESSMDTDVETSKRGRFDHP